MGKDSRTIQSLICMKIDLYLLDERSVDLKQAKKKSFFTSSSILWGAVVMRLLYYPWSFQSTNRLSISLTGMVSWKDKSYVFRLPEKGALGRSRCNKSAFFNNGLQERSFFFFSQYGLVLTVVLVCFIPCQVSSKHTFSLAPQDLITIHFML